MSVVIRPAQSGDAAAATNILRRSIALLCVRDHHQDPADLAAWLANKTLANVQAWIESDDNYCIVASLHGLVCGFGAMTTQGLITLCYVDPATRFAGVSSAMLAALEQEAGRLGWAVARLTTTQTARRFYLSRGYVPNGEEMEKPLQSQ